MTDTTNIQPLVEQANKLVAACIFTPRCTEHAVMAELAAALTEARAQLASAEQIIAQLHDCHLCGYPTLPKPAATRPPKEPQP